MKRIYLNVNMLLEETLWLVRTNSCHALQRLWFSRTNHIQVFKALFYI